MICLMLLDSNNLFPASTYVYNKRRQKSNKLRYECTHRDYKLCGKLNFHKGVLTVSKCIKSLFVSVACGT